MSTYFFIAKKSTKTFLKKKRIENIKESQKKIKRENSIIAPIHLPKSLDSLYTQYFTIVEVFKS